MMEYLTYHLVPLDTALPPAPAGGTRPSPLPPPVPQPDQGHSLTQLFPPCQERDSTIKLYFWYQMLKVSSLAWGGPPGLMLEP